jgi:hypothetical protein
MSKRNIFIVAITFIILLLLIGVLLLPKYFKKATQFLPPPIVQESPENKLMQGKSAIELGAQAARTWQADAEPSYALSTDASQIQGRSNDWQLIFVSPSVKEQGLQINIIDAKISDTKKIPYVGSAAEFPADVITPAVAIAQVKAIPGFADAKILGVEMTYGAAVKTWYWGIRTDKGTMTIKAEQNN